MKMALQKIIIVIIIIIIIIIDLVVLYFYLSYITIHSGPGLFSRCTDSLRAGWSGDRIPLRGGIFRNRPCRPWGPPVL
jgi:hypothetical protein